MRKKFIVVLAFLLLVDVISIVAQGITLEQEIIQISTIVDNEKRLMAYDSLAKTLSKEIKVENKSNWNLNFKQNVMDDSLEFYLSTIAISGDKYSPAAIMIRYKDDIFDLFISFKKYLADENKIAIRFDKEESFVDYWHKSSDKTALFYNGSILDFIDRMALHTKMIVQCYPYNENEYTVVFDITGLKAEMAKIKEKGFFKE
jgi:hypothetical protein